MTNITEFIDQLPDFIGVFILMLSTFLIGYFAAIALQRSKYKAIIKRLKQEVNASKIKKDISDIETIFTEIRPKIVKVVKETQEEINDPPADAEKIIEKTRTSYVTYTKNKPSLNFESFGAASASHREDLTAINGIGPYIEQKLNEIGIYNYDQISRLKEADIRTITELIDFFPGRIDRDNWVAQAQALKVY